MRSYHLARFFILAGSLFLMACDGNGKHAPDEESIITTEPTEELVSWQFIYSPDEPIKINTFLVGSVLATSPSEYGGPVVLVFNEDVGCDVGLLTPFGHESQTLLFSMDFDSDMLLRRLRFYYGSSGSGANFPTGSNEAMITEFDEGANEEDASIVKGWINYQLSHTDGRVLNEAIGTFEALYCDDLI